MPFAKRVMLRLSAVLFVAALVALASMLLPDIGNGFEPSLRHQRAGAFALIFVGTSLICLQMNVGWRWIEVLKGLLLGLAFVLWGTEQFMPPGHGATAVDGLVIAIFVLDLGLFIWGRLEAQVKLEADSRSGKSGG
jgi:hypothetical protein